MEHPDHLGAEAIVDTLEGRRAAGSLAQTVHHHAVQCCARCQEEWWMLDEEERNEVTRRLLAITSFPLEQIPPRFPPFGPDRRDLPAAGSHAAAPIERLEAAKRQRRRKVQQEVWTLLRLPAEERAGLVRRARSRFRSRALAERLIAESRARVRTNPQEAENLASLVPEVLVRFLEPESRRPWATALALSAAAHRANAVRIAGDLREAARQFAEVRREMDAHGVTERHLIAEVASLEASLAMDQRRFTDAEERLAVARLVARRVGDPELSLRLLLKEAFLHWLENNPELVLSRCSVAESLLKGERMSYFHLSLVTMRTAALCDLDRFSAAEETLLQHEELFEQDEDAHTGATLCALRGRIALGLGRLDDAEVAFAVARDELLAAGRHYDAALACLDLAETHLRRGRTAALRSAAPRLVRLFQAHGVEREALAVLRLLARAVADDRLTVSVLRELRRRLRGRRGGFGAQLS